MDEDDEIIKYIFGRWKWDVEYYSEKYGNEWPVTFTDRPICMTVCKKDGKATVLVGLERGFEKRFREYHRFLRTVEKDPTEDDSDDEEADGWGQKWRMETAVDPEEKKKPV